MCRRVLVCVCLFVCVCVCVCLFVCLFVPVCVFGGGGGVLDWYALAEGLFREF